jgi:hypothetical protein
VNRYQIEARRHAREVAGELRWQGMTVPPLYVHMAGELEDLVGSGGYAAWVAANPNPARNGRSSGVGGMTRHGRPASAGRVARRRRLVPGPVLGR